MSQRTSPYLSEGLMNVRFFSKDFLSILNISLLIMLIIVQTLLTINIIWRCQGSHLKNKYQDVCVFGIQFFVDFANRLKHDFCLMYGMQGEFLSM